MQMKAPRLVRWFALASAMAMSTPADAEQFQIVALGDSNSAGFGLFVGKRNAFPAILETRLRAAGHDVTISNRGVSGDTTGGMLSRIESAVPRGTDIAIVQGGYNDGRRGVTTQVRDANIDAILERLSARGVSVVLCGLAGADWAGSARKHQALLVPARTCYDVDSRGIDGLHMNKAGHRVVAARLLPVIERVLRSR